MQLFFDGAKILTHGTAVKAHHAKRNVYHTHWDFDTHASEAANIEADYDAPDSVPDKPNWMFILIQLISSSVMNLHSKLMPHFIYNVNPNLLDLLIPQL